MKRAILILTMVFAALVVAGSSQPPFQVRIDRLTIPYDDAAIFAMPSERMAIEVSAPPSQLHRVEVRQGSLLAQGPNRWTWRAPNQPGDYELDVRHSRNPEGLDLKAFVMVPASRVRNGVLNGYRIGHYPAKPLGGDPMYLPPEGFIEVTDKNKSDRVSPHFRLEQFLTKQKSEYPKYLVLDERLLFVLERIGDELEPLGYDASDIHVMSGYRTPFYNRAIGNVSFSMHQFGRAADIYIDEDRNGGMDDLDKDGKIDRNDAVFLAQMIERLSREPGRGSLIGGVGVYKGTSAHPPFVHVDVRGKRARWSG